MKRVVLNGCFDLFHEGHKYLLETAMGLADEGTVYVLINTDESVHKLKGEGRPIDSLFERSSRITEFVEDYRKKHVGFPIVYIKPFDSEKELADKIDEIQPTMIIKGNDRHDIREIVGSKKWPVLIVPRLHDTENNDISTTSILDKIGK